MLLGILENINFIIIIPKNISNGVFGTKSCAGISRYKLTTYLVHHNKKRVMFKETQINKISFGVDLL